MVKLCAMEITVNGESTDIAQECTAEKLIETLGLTGKRIAMEVNQEIVPRSTFTSHTFSAGDKVEIVHAVGGG